MNGWSWERRQQQAAAIRRWKPWARSTGPKTEDGKRSVSRNAWKHGGYDAQTKEVRRLLAMYASIERQARDRLW